MRSSASESPGKPGAGSARAVTCVAPWLLALLEEAVSRAWALPDAGAWKLTST